MRTRVGAVLATVIIGSILGTASASFAATEKPGDARTSEAAVNRRRAEQQRSTLLGSSELDAVATRQARRMAARGEIYHNPNLGDEVDDWEALGENVGVGASVGEIDDAFWSSPDHRANITGAWDSIGVGVVEESGDVFVVQVFKRTRGGGKRAPNSAGASSSGSASARPRPSNSPAKPAAEPAPASRRPAAHQVRRASPSPVPPARRAASTYVRSAPKGVPMVRAAAVEQPTVEVSPPPPTLSQRLGAAIATAIEEIGERVAGFFPASPGVPLLA